MKRRRTGGAAPTTAWRVSFAAALIAAPLLLYLIFRTAAVGVSPPMAAALPPSDASPLTKAMIFVAADPRRRVPAEVVSAGRQAALTAPLSFEPFFIVARAEEQAGRLPRAIALMEEARRRRPNHLLVHVQLLSYYQSTGRDRELLAELDFVLRRSTAAKQYVYPELARMARTAEGRRTLALLLASDPGWRRDFLTAARRQTIAPGDVLALIEGIRAIRPRADVAPERELYVHALAAAGDHRRGRAIWLETLPPEERLRHALLFDGTFRGVRASPPFGWQFTDNENGRAVRAQGDGGASFLDVSYFGGANVVFAEQMLSLPPGRYRLRTQAKSGSGVTSGSIFWNLTCVPSGDRLARLTLSALRETYGTFDAAFQVSGGCAAQRLQLVGEPGDVAATVDLQIASVEIGRAD